MGMSNFSFMIRVLIFVIVMIIWSQMYARHHNGYEKESFKALKQIANYQMYQYQTNEELRTYVFQDIYTLQQSMLEMQQKVFALRVQLESLENYLIQLNVVKYLPYKYRNPELTPSKHEDCDH